MRLGANCLSKIGIDWGHYLCIPGLSPFELYGALDEVVDKSLWMADKEKIVNEEKDSDDNGYPMDFYSKSGEP